MTNALEKKLGYSFQNKNLFKKALTHSSAVSQRQDSNERLEFLGDRVLGLVVAEMLVEEFPEENEGALGYRFASLVRRETLERVAEELDLEPHIQREIDPQGLKARQRSGLLANACEALIAAIYLDGGYEAARSFVRTKWIVLLKEDLKPPKDSKTRLQEFAQSKGWSLPAYQIVEQTGPDHAPHFVVEVSLGPHGTAQGKGPSKRVAETTAAETLISKLTGTKPHG